MFAPLPQSTLRSLLLVVFAFLLLLSTSQLHAAALNPTLERALRAAGQGHFVEGFRKYVATKGVEADLSFRNYLIRLGEFYPERVAVVHEVLDIHQKILTGAEPTLGAAGGFPSAASAMVSGRKPVASSSRSGRAQSKKWLSPTVVEDDRGLGDTASAMVASVASAPPTVRRKNVIPVGTGTFKAVSKKPSAARRATGAPPAGTASAVSAPATLKHAPRKRGSGAFVTRKPVASEAPAKQVTTSTKEAARRSQQRRVAKKAASGGSSFFVPYSKVKDKSALAKARPAAVKKPPSPRVAKAAAAASSRRKAGHTLSRRPVVRITAADRRLYTEYLERYKAVNPDRFSIEDWKQSLGGSRYRIEITPSEAGGGTYNLHTSSVPGNGSCGITALAAACGRTSKAVLTDTYHGLRTMGHRERALTLWRQHANRKIFDDIGALTGEPVTYVEHYPDFQAYANHTGTKISLYIGTPTGDAGLLKNGYISEIIPQAGPTRSHADILLLRHSPDDRHYAADHFEAIIHADWMGGRPPAREGVPAWAKATAH